MKLTITTLAFIAMTGCSGKNSAESETNPINDLITESGAEQMKSITRKVARDAEEQYGIASRQGDKIQICVQAMSVSAAHLQAKDEPNYIKWKAIEKRDCEEAGMGGM